MINNCDPPLREFHDKKVRLSNRQVKDMQHRRLVCEENVKGGLPQHEGLRFKKFEPQGSIAMDTMVNDPDGKYDIDDGIYFHIDPSVKANFHPERMRQMVHDALEKHSDLDVKVKQNCVRIVNDKDNHHVDMAVYRAIDPEKQELAAGPDWKESHPTGITEWFKQRCAECERQGFLDTGTAEMMVRFVKYMVRQHLGKEPSGFILSLMFVEAKPELVPDRVDSSMKSVLEKMLGLLQNYDSMCNPITDEVLISSSDKHWVRLKNLLEGFVSKLRTIDNGSYQDALRVWGKIFNETFPETDDPNTKVTQELDKGIPAASIARDVNPGKPQNWGG
jgi:hypothetical protein